MMCACVLIEQSSGQHSTMLKVLTSYKCAHWMQKRAHAILPSLHVHMNCKECRRACCSRRSVFSRRSTAALAYRVGT
eukprot:4591283-Pleurochrysis_carterae.AAC.3